jgi:hypothetical protein
MGVRFPPGAPVFALCHDVVTLFRYIFIMRLCRPCGTSQDESEFGVRDKRTGRVHSVCRECRRGYSRRYHGKDVGAFNERRRARVARYRARNQAFVAAYLREHPCADCGVVDLIVLEFDHVRGAKRCSVSDLIRSGARIELLRAEIDKCVVRCANCHRRRTAQVFWVGNARLRKGLHGAVAYYQRSPRGDCSSAG